jgi:hypothetical protein
MHLVTPNFGFFLLLIVLAIAFLFPIIALIDILKSEFKQNDKLVWTMVVIFLSAIGAVLYYAIGRPQRIRQ